VTRHFLDVDDLSADELAAVVDAAANGTRPQVLTGRTVGLVFEKPSLRTRNACETAIVQLGGHPVTMQGAEVGLGHREPAADVARVLSRYHALLGARVFSHDALRELAAHSGVPVVNLLSDEAHPCQAVADLLTLQQHFGKVDGLEVAYVGDFNNVARSLAVAASKAGASIRLACPPGYGPSADDLDRIRLAGGDPLVTARPAEAASGADCVYTDVWTSMGQEEETDARRRAFEGFQVDDQLISGMSARGVFLHCLPAHRGDEVAASVVDGDRSLVWQQAENRLHAFRAIVVWLLDQGAG